MGGRGRWGGWCGWQARNQRGGAGGSCVLRLQRCAPAKAPALRPCVPLPLLCLQMFQLLGWHEFLPSEQLVAALEGQLCRAQPDACISFLAAIAGYNAGNIDTERLPLYLSYTPAGSSVQNMAHWSQVGGWGCGSRGRGPRRTHTNQGRDDRGLWRRAWRALVTGGVREVGCCRFWGCREGGRA